jgi:hypothetical protein
VMLLLPCAELAVEVCDAARKMLSRCFGMKGRAVRAQAKTGEIEPSVHARAEFVQKEDSGQSEGKRVILVPARSNLKRKFGLKP